MRAKRRQLSPCISAVQILLAGHWTAEDLDPLLRERLALLWKDVERRELEELVCPELTERAELLERPVEIEDVERKLEDELRQSSGNSTQTITVELLDERDTEIDVLRDDVDDVRKLEELPTIGRHRQHCPVQLPTPQTTEQSSRVPAGQSTSTFRQTLASRITEQTAFAGQAVLEIDDDRADVSEERLDDELLQSSGN